MPETPEKNAYEILGVARTASLDEIKKRYRELARQFHPDVNQSNPGAAKMFAQITGAYKSISDPETRATYDADLLLKEKRAQASAARSASNSSTRTTTTSRPGSAPSTANGTTQQQRNQAEAARLVNDAQAAFARGRFVEARSLAEQALRLHRRNDRAYEILGDIFRLQGKTDEAINMYSMALQLNPRNPQLMQRLERLTRVSGVAPPNSAQRVFFDNSPRPSATPAPPPRAANTSPPRPPAQPYVPAGMSADRQTLGLVIVGFVGYVSVLLMILFTLLFHGNAPSGFVLIPLISTWNGTLWTVLSLSGLILGITMTVTGAIGRLEDELVFSGGGPRPGFHLPLGMVVIALSVVNFYIAALVYSVSSLLQESFTKSMGRVFGVVVGVVGMLALVYTPQDQPAAQLQVMLWGGNVVFLCFVIGWLIGDIFRPQNI